MTEPMIKGAAIRELLAWYESRCGREGVLRMVARAPHDLRSHIDPDEIIPLLATSWYPARLVHSMLDTISEGLSDAEIERMAREANRAVVSHGMNSVYKFLLEKLATPDIYAATIPRMWRLMHSTGQRRMRVIAPGEAESVVANWPGHHPLLCLITIETMCAIFEKMGCRNVRHERLACVSTGGSECVTRVRWTA
jgi:hypothetical protein